MAKLLSSFLNTSFSTFDSNDVLQLIGGTSSIILGDNTVGNYIESALGGSGILITNSSVPEGANLTIAIDSSVVATLSKSQTLTNKSIDLTNNTLTGSVAQFNTALSGDNFVTETASQTLSNKTLTLPTIGATGASFTGSASGAINLQATATAGTNTITLPAATGILVTEANTATLTNKTINGSNNTLSNIPNTATTADSANTANAIVTRNASGNFSAGTITATLSGNASTATSASTATTLANARTIGDVSFNGSANIVPERILYKDTRAVNHNPYTYVGTTLHLKQNTTDGLADGGTYHGVLDLAHWGDSSGGKDHQLGLTDNGNMYIRNSTSATTWSSWVKIIDSGDTTNLNTANTLVRRDASGNFTAGTITAALTGNASTATTLATGRDFSLTGEVTAPAINFTGAGVVALSTTIAANAVDSSNILALSVSNAKIQANTITSSKFSSVTSLIIYNSAGTVLKTIYSPST